MKRILITPEIEALAKDYADKLFIDQRQSYRPKKKLEDLAADLDELRAPEYKKYVETIHDNYEEILTLKPSMFEDYNIQHFSHLNVDYGRLFNKKKFFELVVDAMGYKAVREKEFLPYVRKLDIKACVYCNTQFAITTAPKHSSSNGMSGKRYRATYQLDHFFPKSKYPFLCTSFFNLQPACANCNGAKGNRKAEFQLYAESEADLVPFKFRLDDAGLIKYLLSNNPYDLKVKLDVTDPNNKTQLPDGHEEMFHIDEIYSELSDVVEEIVWKSKIYNASYLQQLNRSFEGRIAARREDFKRFLIGNYADVNNIHKRPLALLVQSITKELGII